MTATFLRRNTAVVLALLALLGATQSRGARVEAQNLAAPSRPWSCWSVPTTGGAFAASSFSDRVCGAFVEAAAKIQFAPRPTPPARIAVPPAPTGLTVVISEQSVFLSWSAAADPATTFTLEAGSLSGLADLANTTTASNAHSLVATGMPPGRYYMRVRAQNASATSAASNEVPVLVLTGACSAASDAPQNLTSSATGSTVTLNWSAPASGCAPTAYVIEAGGSPGASNLANFSTGSSATSFSASGVGSGVYYVRVKSTTIAGTSAASNETTLSVGSCATAPSAPAVLTSSVNGSTVVLTWSASNGMVSSYIIEAGTATGLTNVLVSDTGSTATSLTAGGVGSAGYYVRVRARNACGTSAPSIDNLVVVPGSTGTGLLTGATSFAGPYPSPAEVTYTDPTSDSGTVFAFPGQVQVFVSGISQASAEAAIGANGGLVLARTPIVGYYLAGVAAGQETAFVGGMGRVSGVVDVFPNPVGFGAGQAASHGAIFATATAPGATVFESCAATNTHRAAVIRVLIDNGGVLKRCRDITADDSRGLNDFHQVVTAILAEANENGASTPTLINLSTYGTAQDSSGRWLNGGDYNAQPAVIRRNLVRNWKLFMTAVLNSIGALPPEYRKNFLITICAGNNNMPITSALADLRKNPRFAAILSANVLVSTTTLTKGNYSTTDGDVAYCNNPEAANGTSFAAPGCLAVIQNVMAATGATLDVAIKAAKQAIAGNASHRLVLSEAVLKAQALLPPAPVACTGCLAIFNRAGNACYLISNLFDQADCINRALAAYFVCLDTCK